MRVVNTSMLAFAPSLTPDFSSATANRTFAPVDFPIQLRCMAMTRSGHPPSSNFKSSSSCSAYAVVFKNHCSSSRDSTSVSSCRQQYPFRSDDPLRPSTFQQFQIVQQLLRIRGGLQEPLLKFARFHQRIFVSPAIPVQIG